MKTSRLRRVCAAWCIAFLTSAFLSGCTPLPGRTGAPPVPLGAPPNVNALACPEGTNEKSPAFQRRVRCRQQASPEGTAEHREHHTRTAAQNISEELALIALLLFIVIAVFVPASIPILGRVFALLINRIPALAGFSGLVSVEAFDAIVKAIERGKENVRVANESNEPGSLRATASDRGWIGELHEHLSREMDASHKRLVQSRKRTFVR